MLKLRKVEIVGFKSFCERTTVTFSGTGTTCIVGPNGCGKSNVVDAISWVLGEQSHKSLRAERMADCIFNGTTKRPPMGLAEVSLTMEDPELAEAARFVMEGAAEESKAETPGAQGSTEKMEILGGAPAQAAQGQTEFAGEQNGASEVDDPLPAEPEFIKSKRKKKADKPVLATKPGEVVVCRRLFRSGQSEYLINGRAARLRDIQEMFMGVGLGPDSYAIIEQGRIGLILSTKPMERRAIIEEAAGVTKFKTKKRLAEAKLESSKINLSRVNDIVVEVEKQLGSLKRQAAKARRYSEIRDQMRGIVRQMLAGKARELDAEAERLAKALEELSSNEAQHAHSIQQREAEQDRLNQRIYSLDAEIRQNQNVLNLTALEVDASRPDRRGKEPGERAGYGVGIEERGATSSRKFFAGRIERPCEASRRARHARASPKHADRGGGSSHRGAPPHGFRNGGESVPPPWRAEAGRGSAPPSGRSSAEAGGRRGYATGIFDPHPRRSRRSGP